VLDKETTLSSKIDFIVYVKGKLNLALTTLIAANDVPAAQNVQRFLGTPDHIHDGYFARIEKSFEPITPNLMLAVQALNAGYRGWHIVTRELQSIRLGNRSRVAGLIKPNGMII
jgi:hypothetical protein